MDILRELWSVGHGGFITEKFLRGGDSRVFTVVYDCGSKRQDSIEKAIDQSFEKDEVIDLVCLSHFHADHINGALHLLGHTRVKSMMVPEFNHETLLGDYVVAAVSRAGAFNPLYPALIFLRALAEPQYGDFELPHIVSLSPDQADNPEAAIELSAMPSIGKIYSGTQIWTDSRWLYLPYNIKMDDTLSEDVLGYLKEKLGLKQTLSIWEINSALADEQIFNDVQRFYRKRLKDANHSSMVLYSGRPYPLEKSWDNALYMGDYNANVRNVDELRRVMNKRFDRIGLIQVPHHGSIHNYSKQSSLYDNGVIAVTFANEDSSTHPAQIIVDDIVRHHGISMKVTYSEYTKQQFLISI